MATRKAQAILRTSDTGRGRIYSSPRNTQDTHALMVARRTTMRRAAMPVVITPSTWSRESSSDTDVEIDQLQIHKEKRRDDIQKILTDAGSSRVVRGGVGGRYRRQSHGNERALGGLRRHHRG